MTAAWPTCLCVAPRRFFVSQYGVRGVVAYRIGSDAKLRFEKTLGADAFSYPEGLASVSAFLIVATCEGLIVTLDVHTGLPPSALRVSVGALSLCESANTIGSVVHRVLCGEPLTLWCVLARRCRGNRDNLELYLTAHSAGLTQTPTARSTRYCVSPNKECVHAVSPRQGNLTLKKRRL